MMEVIASTRVSIERTPFFFTSGSFAARIAANMRTYLRKVTGAALGSANLPIATCVANSSKGCELNSPPLCAKGANLPWCKPLQTLVCTLTVGDACACLPRIGSSPGRTPFTWAQNQMSSTVPIHCGMSRVPCSTRQTSIWSGRST